MKKGREHHGSRGTGNPACAARRFSRAVFFLMTASLLAACAVGPYADTPRYELPNTRTTAARQLNEALAFDALGISEVAADELKLTWHEFLNITPKRKQMVERELDFKGIYSVARPEQPGELWELKVYAAGGTITFNFKQGPQASKAESALRRLMQPLTDDEQKQLARKFLRILNGQVEQYRRKNGKVTRNPDWLPIEDTIDSMKLLTGRDFSEEETRDKEIKAWQNYLTETYNP